MEIAELEKMLKNLQDNVRNLQDIEEIRILQKTYGFYLEHWQADEIVDLFSDDPETSVEISASGVYIGKDSIRELFMEGANPPPEFLHVLTQINDVIHVDQEGKTAKGRWYGVGFLADPINGGAKAALTNGIYENEYVKENGKWKIKKLHWYLIFRTPFEDGWAKTPTMPPRKRNAKPDLPSTGHNPYPSGYIAPYHYKNPVTEK